jgi:Tol biopolymer transport system component
MPSFHNHPRAAWPLLLLLAACGSDGQGPAAGVLRVAVVTSGTQPDLDGYTVVLDDGVGHAVTPNGQRDFSGLRSGQHRIRIEGIAPNCVPDRYSQLVALAENETRDLTVTVACRAPLRAGLVYFAHPFQKSAGWFQADSTGQVGTALPGVAVSSATYSPVISPGGTRALFTFYAAGAYHVAAANLDGTGQVDLSAASGRYGLTGIWSPDGSRVAFSQPGVFGIATMYADGSGVSVLPVNGTPVAWSPDGRYLLALGNGSQGAQLRLDRYDLATAAQLPLRSVTAPAAIDAATYSPDGRHIDFFEHASGTSGAVYRIPAGGGTPVPLIQGFLGVGYSVAWSPDGARVAVNADSAFVPSIYVVNANGSGRRDLTPGVEYGRTASPTWTE